jgi:hypothetical protein
MCPPERHAGLELNNAYLKDPLKKKTSLEK